MTDVLITWDINAGTGSASIDTATGDIAIGSDLASAVYCSLFSDRRASPFDKLAPGETSRRGWYGDTYLQTLNSGDLLGSRLWLLDRSTSDENLPARARGYILEALKWMLDDRVASRIDVHCYFIRNKQNWLGATIAIYRLGQSRADRLEFQWAWQQIFGAGAP